MHMEGVWRAQKCIPLVGAKTVCRLANYPVSCKVE